MTAARRESESTRTQYAEEVKKNERLKNQVQDVQSQYIRQAEDRLEVTRALYQMLSILQKSDWRKEKFSREKLVESTQKLADDCQARARKHLDELEAYTQKDMKINQAEADEAMNDLSASSQLEDVLGKFVRQNNQLERDIKGRQVHFETEQEMTKDYIAVALKVAKMIEDRVGEKDTGLVTQILEAAPPSVLEAL